MSKKILNICILYLSFSSLNAFSFEEGYKLALKNDMDSFIKKSNLKSAQYDKDIARASYKPTINLNANASATKNSQTNKNIDKADSYGLEITQNVFNGFKSDYETKLQKERYTSVKFELDESQNKLAYLYTQSYINVLKERDLLALKIENLNMAQDIFNKVYKKVKLDYGTKLEFEEAKASYSKAKVDLSIQKINYRSAIESLKYYVQSDIDASELIRPQFYYELPRSLNDALKLVEINNPSYLLSKVNVEISKLEQKRDVNTNYPNVDVVGSYNMYDSFYSDNNEYDEYKLGLEINYNLYNGGKDTAQNNKALESIKEKEFLLRKNKFQVDNKLRLAWSDYKLKKEKKFRQEDYALSKKDVLRTTISEFDLGLKTLNNLLNENSAYIDVKSKVSSSSYDYLLSKYKLLESIGTLSQKMGNKNLTLEKHLTNQLNIGTQDPNQNKVKASAKVLLPNNILKDEVEKPQKDNDIFLSFSGIEEKEKEKVENIEKIAVNNLIAKAKVKNEINKNRLFKDEFLNANKDNFTINLAYFRESRNAEYFLKKNNLTQNAFSFSFGKNLSMHKVMMGIYDSKKDAVKALSLLSNGLKKSKPRVERIKIKQNLYKKYHNDEVFTKSKIYNKNTKVKKANKLYVTEDNEDNYLEYKAFKEKFLNANKNKYTINIAHSDSKAKAKRLLKRNGLLENGFYFSFRKIKPLQKIMYGVFDTKIDAKEALSKLPKKLLKNRPVVEKVSLKQKLYYKYNSNKDNKKYFGSI